MKEENVSICKASLVGVGDALLHMPVCNAGYNFSIQKYDFNDMMKYIKQKIKNYDIKYYNQEVIFDDDKEYTGYPLFNAPSDWGTNMTKDIGFNLVSLATNHSMDGGIESAKKSAQWWEKQKGILATGMASTEKNRNEYRICEVKGITYTMLSYTYGTNGIPVTEEYVVNVFDEEKVLRDIKEVRDKVDVLIVAMHWGEEYTSEVTELQKQQAKFLSDNGANIIIGNHTHCIQPWERIGENTVVFYSLGNFISNQMSSENPIIKKVGSVGLLSFMDIIKIVDKRNNTSEIKLNNIGAEMLYTYKYFNNKKQKDDYLIIPFSKMKKRFLNNYKEIFYEYSEVLKRFDDEIKIVPLK